MKKKYICLTIIALTPIIIYIINFGESSISKDPEKWAFFGDYIGGVYSVVLTCVLTFIMYQLNKKDEKSKEKKDFVKSLLCNINEFNNSTTNLNLDKVDEFRKLIINNEFIIDESLFRTLIDIGDYYLSLCSDISNRDIERESRIKRFLKELYDGK
ncbi:hypothetical protein [Bacteroides sp. ET225]|uniref:hypothetical protein n=1 Tax=Bacteroides sp. ET225 TaxID=2972461 RepID=UPI0021ABED28|nr:hypothetical protein [Bacteroides sp. ET225]MCR8918359.1 hypothetical protein [Bacteroides sp. ET225]